MFVLSCFRLFFVFLSFFLCCFLSSCMISLFIHLFLSLTTYSTRSLYVLVYPTIAAFPGQAPPTSRGPVRLGQRGLDLVYLGVSLTLNECPDGLDQPLDFRASTLSPKMAYATHAFYGEMGESYCPPTVVRSRLLSMLQGSWASCSLPRQPLQ